MAGAARVHAFVFCWPGKEAGAHHIAESLAPVVDRLTVLYKNDTGVEETGPGEWKRIPSENFYGWQFRHSLDLFDGDVCLHVQADASHGDWPGLVARCRHAWAAFPQMGIWTPNVWYSMYEPRLVRSTALEGEDLVSAVLTDGIVWALSREVTDWMRGFDYTLCNFGWGVCEAAAAVAATRGRLIAMDTSVRVQHPTGSGYDRAKALAESARFTAQLSAVEMSYIRTSQLLMHYREKMAETEPLAERGRLLTPRHWRALAKRLLRPMAPAPQPAPGGDPYRMLV